MRVRNIRNTTFFSSPAHLLDMHLMGLAFSGLVVSFPSGFRLLFPPFRTYKVFSKFVETVMVFHSSWFSCIHPEA